MRFHHSTALPLLSLYHPITLSPFYHLFINEETLFFPILIGTGFGSGFSPFAPGTAGALLAALIWFGLSFIVSEICLIWLTVVLVLVFTVMGIWATNRLEPCWGEDPSRVVVDEMVGVWIALLAAPSGNVWYALGAFALFVCSTFLSRWESVAWKVFLADLE